MIKWVAAQNTPKSWENQEVWQWNEWQENSRPFWNIVPAGFSRELRHCKGVWYRKFIYPKPPRAPVSPAHSHPIENKGEGAS